MKMILLALTTFGFLFSGESTATYRVEGMMCGVNCPQKVNNSLNGISPDITGEKPQ